MRRIAKCSRLVTVCAVFCLVVACGGGGGGSSTPSAPKAPGPLSIDLKAPFTDTGVNLTAGESVTITASGEFNNGTCGGATTCDNTPNGEPYSACANLPPGPFTAPGLNCYSLIGKIGTSGTPFEVGSSFVLTASVAGELFLGVNDNYYADNTGSWLVTISQT